MTCSSVWAGQAGAAARVNALNLTNLLRAQLGTYLSTRRVPEHISGVSLRITYPDKRPSIALALGSKRYDGGPPLSTSALWQIGSNTKAFTSVMLLQLEAEHQLSISDRLGRWLPQYRAWRQIRVRQLLDMTSGIQDYDEQPAFLRAYAANPDAVFSTSRLVSYVTRRPLLKGWNYSNTNYILAQTIIQRVTHDTFAAQLRKRIVGPLRLHNLFFSPTRYSTAVTVRMPAGYFFNSSVSQFAPLLGKDQRRAGVSSNQGAGGIVASLADVATWDRALYSGRELPRRQQRELESLVSMRTGKPIRATSSADPQGFGLGVGQAMSPATGTFWFYEGTTFGYRVLHLYSPRSGMSIVVAANSSSDQDELSELGLEIYELTNARG